jgi:hypothetical protein
VSLRVRFILLTSQSLGGRAQYVGYNQLPFHFHVPVEALLLLEKLDAVVRNWSPCSAFPSQMGE